VHFKEFIHRKNFSVVAGSKWRLVFVHTTKKEIEARVFKIISNCLKALSLSAIS